MCSQSNYEYYMYRSQQSNLDNARENKDQLSGETDDIEYYTQDQLNDMFLGPEFGLEIHYASALLIFFICYVYSAGMPILLWLGVIGFGLQYRTDKFLFCNHFRTPPMYSDTMGRAASGTIGWAIFAHLIISIWIMGNKAIFVSDTFSYEGQAENYSQSSFNPLRTHENLEQRHVVPLVTVLVGLVAFWFINRQTKEFTSFTKKFINFITCGRGDTTDTLMGVTNQYKTTYTSARRRHIIKGLNNYNVLENPKYQKAFGVTADFAKKHKHVKSIRKLNADNQSKDMDNDPPLLGDDML